MFNLLLITLMAGAVCVLLLGLSDARQRATLARHQRGIRKLWRDRDELRGEVNALRAELAAGLQRAGVGPEVVKLSAMRPRAICMAPLCDEFCATETEVYCPAHKSQNDADRGLS